MFGNRSPYPRKDTTGSKAVARRTESMHLSHRLLGAAHGNDPLCYQFDLQVKRADRIFPITFLSPSVRGDCRPSWIRKRWRG